ncbi:hypothetical protein HZS61_012590 [Fusarium oxysporum f. sp. conglutinans]|uniref:HECT-type E3 ubiquitin transferase n=1 Tax=Fusarium oxysporum f. sp. conglutinans TaxID=100902 RepID=A0A8H6GUX5_FUSOX|nr:hypothetical protein HZS61_012590 [Fusarium oxysporum f. sp. conglutinans]
MTPDAVRPRDHSIELTADLDLLAGLWQEAPFARLPADAPPELKAYVQNVENPARVYAIHQASRRHGFQLLVERYILQLRSGCENVNCATPTCFTCRRRLAGRAPIRRYNTTSARTLAIYLASQDDPEKGLCPFLRKSREPPAAFGNLIFSTRSSSPSHPDHNRANVATSPSARKERLSRPRAPSSSSQDALASPMNDPSDPVSPIQNASRPAAACTPHSKDRELVSQIRVIEAPMSKDHRSFAANLFGTVTFKMLEWLTPRSVAAMAAKISNLDSVVDFDFPQDPASSARTTACSDIQSTAPDESDTTDSTTVAVQPHATDMNETSFMPKPAKPSNGSLSKPRKNAVPKHKRRSTDSNNTSKSGDNKHKGFLSDIDAGYLMSICMHALVAAAPAVQDSRTLYEMSRVRSNGLTLAGRSAMARQSSSRCLDYDDAFSNDLAIRLARRLFCAITARRYFSNKMDNAGPLNETENNKVDILQSLVDQLDFLSTGSAMILEFPQSERLLHETRVPTILLDWARTILLNEWDGRADFDMDGPFGGALSFIETLHANRNLLLLGDIQFRVDYLSERLDSIEMPVDWLAFNSTRWRRHILDYPYIFSPDTLVSFFRSINFARMSRMFEESSSLKTRMSAIVDPGSLITNPHHKMVLQDLLRTASSKYLVLEIGRSNVARDAFDQLWRREKRELLRPLKVHLGENSGEEGFDSGGVQQEFFRLAIAECLDPQYGAFTVDERTRMAWFTPGSLTEDWKYELVGLLMSLALYNGLTLPITFPKALYRKLLGKPVEELHHIADGWPDLASGLTTLLEWDEKDGLVEDIFARTYEFSVESLGTVVTRDMRMGEQASWPKAASSSCDIAPPHMDNPDDAPLVTNENRDDYIIDYIRHLTDVSIRRQYLAFEQGFNSCLDKKSLSLLSPSTLQSLVEGVQEIDIIELKRYARYVGWDASHRTIKDFWSIVKRYDERMKQRLLEFVTSSDRVPVGGMKNLQFVIQKNGEEDGTGGHLPTAYTCYGTLLLPEYRDKEVLRERLGMALENAQGFGFA